MNNVTTAVARTIAMEAGATLAIQPGAAFDCSDAGLSVLADALLALASGTGVDFLAFHREGTNLVALVNDDAAEEPLCPATFDRMVRRLAFDRLGEVWSATLVAASAPAAASVDTLARVA